MKLKVSWPAGIILSLGAFIVFILSYVYKATFVPAYDHHLVSEDYYKDELNYQQEIDKLSNAAKLKQNITHKRVATGLLISFPAEFDPIKIKGTIALQRPSNSKIDFKFPINLITSDYLIKEEKLVEGRWNLKIEWSVNDNYYLFKDKLMY